MYSATIFEIAQNNLFENGLEAFERFCMDGCVNSADMYAPREHEDFSPEGEINVAYFNNYPSRHAARIIAANSRVA
jgi:hypothetical protein